MDYYQYLIQTVLYAEAFALDDLQKQKIDKDDKKEILEAFVFKIDASWQTLVRGLFVDCLSRDLTKYSESTHSSLPKHLPWQVCRAMVNGLNFFDFRNTEDIKKLGNKYLVDRYNPFKKISDSVGKKIDEFYTIRNFLTHQSSFSMRKLKIMYKKKYGISSFRDPGLFLLTHDKKDDQIRFGVYMECMNIKAKEMKLFLKNK